jgi:hypothetical protein
MARERTVVVCKVESQQQGPLPLTHSRGDPVALHTSGRAVFLKIGGSAILPVPREASEHKLQGKMLEGRGLQMKRQG